MNYSTITAEHLIDMKLNEVESLQGLFVLVFKDGTKKPTTPARLLITWQVWEVIRRDRRIELKPEYAFTDQDYHAATIDTMYEKIVHGLQVASGREFDCERVAVNIYETQNLIYNDSIDRYAEYVTSIDVFDFTDISTHPDIVAARNVEPFDEDAVENLYKVTQETLKLPEFKNRTKARATRARIVPPAPINQTDGSVGFLRDFDDTIFPNAIRNGYVKGVMKLSELLAESRKTTTSLFYQKKPMQDSELFRRELELQTNVINEVVGDICVDSEYYISDDSFDCGTTRLISYEPKSKREISLLSGAMYRTKDEGRLRELTEDDTHLVGEMIMFRSPVYCEHIEHGKVCATCYGTISKSLSKMTSIGHLAASEFTHSTSQSVVGMKHLIASASNMSIMLDKHSKRFISLGETPRSLKLNRGLKGKGKLLIQQKYIKNIVDVNVVEDFKNYKFSRIGDIYEIIIEIDGVQYDIATTMATTPANLTSEFLTFCKEHGWKSDRRKYLIFDLENWDFSKDFLSYPMKGASIYEKMKSVKTFIFGSVKRGAHEERLAAFTDPGDGLMELFRVSSDFVSVNIVHQALIVRALLCNDISIGDYRLPVGKNQGVLVDNRALMRNRSASAMMSWQFQSRFLNDPGSFIYKSRPSQGYDMVFA